ncbi:hypothetical protein [Hydrogenimonas sp.]
MKEHETDNFIRLDENYKAIVKEIAHKGILRHYVLYKSCPAAKKEPSR